MQEYLSLIRNILRLFNVGITNNKTRPNYFWYTISLCQNVKVNYIFQYTWHPPYSRNKEVTCSIYMDMVSSHLCPPVVVVVVHPFVVVVVYPLFAVVIVKLYTNKKLISLMYYWNIAYIKKNVSQLHSFHVQRELNIALHIS